MHPLQHFATNKEQIGAENKMEAQTGQENR